MTTQLDQVIDELVCQNRKHQKQFDLAVASAWVAKRVHRYKDIQEACEYYFEFN